MMRIIRSVTWLAQTSAVVVGVAHASSAQAQVAAAPVAFDIPAGPLRESLARYAEQAGIQLLYSPKLAAGRRAPSLRGRFEVHAALERLVAGTNIAIRQIDAHVFVLSAATKQSSATTDTPPASGEAIGNSNSDIVVTGTHIRGTSPASPTRVLSRADIARNGYSSIAQALQALPSNFSGMANEQSALAFSDRSGTNLALASGVNLRGLGPDATLVLVNGRRIAGSGLVGDFADISSLPISALERVEVVTDGASALYGSDAVAGVVNIILKPDFDGFESHVRAGTVTRGHARELQVSQTAGTHWSSGSVIVSYELQKRRGLLSSDRAYARSADSRPFGGTDHRYSYSLPGNVLGFGADGSLNPAFAIPADQDGSQLSASQFLPGVTNLENFRTGSDLTPDQTRHSVYARAVQTLSDGIDVSLEGRFADRKFDSRTFGYATVLSITDANPWFVSPTGASSDLIGYAFTRELGPTRTAGSARSLGLTAALNAKLWSDWRLSTYASLARQRDTSRTDHIANEYILAEALGSIPDDPASPYSPARDGYFNPYGNGTANSAELLDAISGFIDTRTRSRVLTFNALADGSLFSLPAGAVKLAVGLDYRQERFSSQSVDFYFAPTPDVGPPSRYSRGIWATFAELHVPLIGRENGLPGVEQLDFTAAVRTERYSDFGQTTNPKLALRWVPMDGIAVRATWGTSFRAPNLRELGQTEAISPTLLRNAAGSSVVVLQRSGGNPELQPERARSWTLGLDLKPAMTPGLTASLTAFRTVFDRRIDQPTAQNFSNALVDPSLAPFVRPVSPATDATDRALVEQLLAQAGGTGSYPVESIAAIVDSRYVNTGRVDVAGFDLDLGYAFDVGDNHINLGANATYLARWREQLTPTAAIIDQRNLAGRPVDLRGRLTVGWSRGAWDALAGMNYVDHYRDLDGTRIAAWTTFDVRLAYTPQNGALAGLSAAIVAQNLFDRAPPFYDSSVGAGYDAANSDAIGRFVALEISKHW